MVGHALRVRATLLDPDFFTTQVVIFESTVYPGATEEICVPIIEAESQSIFNKGFVCGYSPERINPGDTAHTLTSIVKITSGNTPDSADWIDRLYASIIVAGTHKVHSIRIAESAKVIENTQRYLNIALVNELAIIFNNMGIDTLDVLEAACTKWNFISFRPGLVGGHCIGVDPHYLTFKAKQLGYYPRVVIAGRTINNGMGQWVVQQLVMALACRHIGIGGLKVLVLGFTFKENCFDIRNTRVIDLITSMNRYGIQAVVIDPWVNDLDAARHYGINVHSFFPSGEKYRAIIVAVARREFSAMNILKWNEIVAPNCVLYDIKGIVPRELYPIRL